MTRRSIPLVLATALVLVAICTAFLASWARSQHACCCVLGGNVESSNYCDPADCGRHGENEQ